MVITVQSDFYIDILVILRACFICLLMLLLFILSEEREGVSYEPTANRTKNNDSVALFELCCSLPSPQE